LLGVLQSDVSERRLDCEFVTVFASSQASCVIVQLQYK